VLAALAIANTAAAAEAARCEISRATDVLRCATQNHPNVVQAKSQIPIASINREISARWPNPDLDGGVVYANEDDGQGWQAEIGIMQTIETPSKRQARAGKAMAELASATILTEEQKETTALQVLAMLNRLRQIEKELTLLQKTIATFENVIKKYKARPALPPEDKISLDLFKFALNSYQIEKDQLASEKKGHASNLKFILDSDITITDKVFLYPPQVWPAITDGAINSIELAKENINIDRANADYLEAKSSSFGGVRVGPYVQTKPGNFGRIDAYGIKFSLPIPLYSNSKPLEAGRMAVASAKRGYEFKQREIDHGFAVLREQYDLGVSFLKKYNISDVEKHQASTQKLFDGGRVSGALLIEAHRQALDNVKTYHKYELETLQALWKLYALQRKLLTNLDEVCHE
jgi:outer membrane protein TolC